jgi:hypothetical protein
MPTRPRASPSTAKPAQRLRSSSTGRVTEPMGRFGAASCCAATSNHSSALHTSSLFLCPAARLRFGNRGAPARPTSRQPTAQCLSSAGPSSGRA